MEANHVILADFWWNSSVQDQAIDRIHRIGQTRDVFVHSLAMQGSIELKLLSLHLKKRRLADAIMGDKKVEGQGINQKDLIDLLNH